MGRENTDTNILMDQYIRAEILECIGITRGVDIIRGDWTRSPKIGLEEASRVLVLHPEWTLAHPWGMYRNAIACAKRMLASTEQAQEVVQNVLGNLTLTCQAGALGHISRNPKVYDRLTQRDSLAYANNLLSSHVAQRSMDILRPIKAHVERNPANISLNQTKDDEDRPFQLADPQEYAFEDQVWEILDGPGGVDIKARIYNVEGVSEKNLYLWQYWMDTRKRDAEIVRELNKLGFNITVANVSNAKRQVIQRIREDRALTSQLSDSLHSRSNIRFY